MKPVRVSQAERRAETREQVVAAASRVFAERGFHGASLEAVAEEAGFTRGAVYYNFAGKEELFMELLERRCADRERDLREVFPPGGDIASTSVQAQEAARHALAAITDDREWQALFFEFLAHAARDARFRRIFARRMAQMQETLRGVVRERAALAGDALPMEPEHLATAIDALGTGLSASHLLHGRRAVPPELYSQVLELIIDGIAARAGVFGEVDKERS